MTASSPRLASAPNGIVLGSAPYGSAPEAEPTDPATLSLPECLLTANVRLDNAQELRHKLELPANTSDHGLLQSAWLRWGPEMLDHLRGGFAFALWDPRQQALFLARDHAGERPLHFTEASGPGGAFSFASMPLALCALPWIGRSIHIERFAKFLALTETEDSQAMFRGVRRLPPGHCLTVTSRGVDVRRYWHPLHARRIRYRRDGEYVEDFRERFDQAVSDRLGQRGVASELSGGLDSSSVTATAARLLAQRGQGLTSFTGVPLPEYGGEALPGCFGDEGPAAAEVAALYPSIEHVRVQPYGDMLQASARAARLMGEPALNPTNQLWVYAILNGMRERGLDVLLQGVSGNATISFAGLVGLSELFLHGRWFKLLRLVHTMRSRGYTSWRGAAGWATGPVTPLWLRRLYQPEMREFDFSFSPVHPDRAAEFHLEERVFESFYGSDRSSDSLRQHIYEYFDPGVFNGATAAGWNIEQRDPTHDRRVYEFCFGIPIQQYLVGGQSRSLVRRAMKDRLPESTLRRTTRGQQAADWYLIIGSQLDRLRAELTRLESSPLVTHLIDTRRLRTLLDTWPTSGWGQPHVNDEYHMAVTRGFGAAVFLAQHDPGMPQAEGAKSEGLGAVPSPS